MADFGEYGGDWSGEDWSSPVESWQEWNNPGVSQYTAGPEWGSVMDKYSGPQASDQFQLRPEGGGLFTDQGRSGGGGMLNFQPGSLGAGGGGGGMQSPIPPSLLQQLLGGGLGAAGGVASLIAQLNAGNKQTVTRNMTPQQSQLSGQQSAALNGMVPGAQSLFNAGASNLGALNAGTNPLQTQQNSILGALAPTAANLGSGNVQIPPALQDLVRRAYEPYVGNIAQQAIESARNRGFSGGAELLNTGPAGAIAGPALANASGMEAQSLLQAMLQFPQASANIAGAFNQPLAQQANVGQASLMPQNQLAQGYGQAFRSYPQNTTITGSPNGVALGNAIGSAIGGANLGFAKPGQEYQNQVDQQKKTQAWWDQISNPQMPNSGGMA